MLWVSWLEQMGSYLGSYLWVVGLLASWLVVNRHHCLDEGRPVAWLVGLGNHVTGLELGDGLLLLGCKHDVLG